MSCIHCLEDSDLQFHSLTELRHEMASVHEKLDSIIKTLKKP